MLRKSRRLSRRRITARSIPSPLATQGPPSPEVAQDDPRNLREEDRRLTVHNVFRWFDESGGVNDFEVRRVQPDVTSIQVVDDLNRTRT